MMRIFLTVSVFSLFGMTASAQYASDWNPDSDGDNTIGVNDLLALLSVFEETDSDNDGIFDSQDDCVGAYDACGVCNGTGMDVDVDGICDDVDPCVGELDVCGVCDEAFGACEGLESFTFDGYSYDIVAIGDQCWFAEDLNYNPLNSNWEDLSFIEARTYALPESFANGTPQGARYNFVAVEQLELCPAGWHVPSSEDIDVFENFLEATFPGGNEGLAIRNDSAWTLGTNETDFNAFPMPDYTQSNQAHWWTTSSSGYPDAEGFYQSEPYTEFARHVAFSRNLRFGVRCIKDAE